MPFIGLIEPDEKTSLQVQTTLEPFCKEKSCKFLSFKATTELDAWLAKEGNTEETCILLIMHIALNDATNEFKIRAAKDKYKTDVVALAFEDEKVPGYMILSLPVENLIYKPLDPAILFEHVRFAVQKSDLLKPTAVHSLAEKCEIEKIRRFEIIGLSDFGLICKTPSELQVGFVCKFYHPIFLDKLKQSAWARLIAKDGDLHYFVYCNVENNFTNLLRKRIIETKTKAKTIEWRGYTHETKIPAPRIYLQLGDQDEKQKLIEYLGRKFPGYVVTDWKHNPKDPKTEIEMLITDQVWSTKLLEQTFTKKPIVVGVGRATAKDPEIRASLETDFIRMSYPLDRNFLGKTLASIFPDSAETEPATATWITSEQKLLQSEPIEAHQLSEAAFTYNRNPVLARGSLQEFAITEDDESEIKPILAKTQFSVEKPNAEGNFTHQIVFFGIRDSSLKKLRLWMRLRHIQAQAKNS